MARATPTSRLVVGLMLTAVDVVLAWAQCTAAAATAAAAAAAIATRGSAHQGCALHTRVCGHAVCPNHVLCAQHSDTDAARFANLKKKYGAKWAVVTGASSGIGKELARSLLGRSSASSCWRGARL